MLKKLDEINFFVDRLPQKSVNDYILRNLLNSRGVPLNGYEQVVVYKGFWFLVQNLFNRNLESQSTDLNTQATTKTIVGEQSCTQPIS